jgi:hypothetical protein
MPQAELPRSHQGVRWTGIARTVAKTKYLVGETPPLRSCRPALIIYRQLNSRLTPDFFHPKTTMRCVMR